MADLRTQEGTGKANHETMRDAETTEDVAELVTGVRGDLGEELLEKLPVDVTHPPPPEARPFTN